jgi:hypothetical protein
MPRAAFIHLFALTMVAVSSCSPPVNSGDDENWRRLRTVPRERRLWLAEKLKQFDGLDRATQASVRKLDARLADLPPADRANYLAVLRRYHLWLEGLTESQRGEINAQPPDRRMTSVARIAAEPSARPGSPDPLVLRLASMGDLSPYDLATQVKFWLALTSAEKAEVSRLEDPARQRRLMQLGHEHKVTPVPRPAAADEDAAYERVLKKGLSGYVAAKKKDDTAKKEELTKWAKTKSRLLDHFSFLENPPDKVSSDNLARFSAALPPWIRSQCDPLPPEEARRRLTVLYRLVFPKPLEFVEPKAAAPEAPRAPVPAPIRPPANTTPF